MAFVPDLIPAPAGPEGVPNALCRDGTLVCAPQGAQWPDRCVVCNAPAAAYRLRTDVAWYPPIAYVLLLALPLFLALAPFVRQAVTVHVGICPLHRRRRRVAFVIGPVGVLLGMTGCAGALELVPQGSDALAVGIFLTALIAISATIVWCMFQARVLVPDRVQNGVLWAKCSKAFLLSLPQRSPTGRVAG